MQVVSNGQRNSEVLRCEWMSHVWMNLCLRNRNKAMKSTIWETVGLCLNFIISS